MHNAAHPSPAAETGAPMALPGVFVTFEGVDGAGKTTQCALLCAALEASGREVVRLREPGGTVVGERVRSILLDPALDAIDPTCELLLYEAARAQLVHEVVLPALERGAFVVSDRFFDSTVAYQGFARGLGKAAADGANRIACGPVAPQRTLLLDMDPRGAWSRATQDGADRMELEGMGFQEQVRAGFLQVASEDPRRVRIVDAKGTVGEVWSRVRTELADLVDLPEAPPALSATPCEVDRDR